MCHVYYKHYSTVLPVGKHGDPPMSWSRLGSPQTPTCDESTATDLRLSFLPPLLQQELHELERRRMSCYDLRLMREYEQLSRAL